MVYLSKVLTLLCITSTLVILRTEAAPVGDISDSDTDSDGNREKRETFDLLSFLSQYGYLESPAGNGNKGLFQSDDVIIDAIKEFQRFNGLEVTGIPDRETMTKMKTPRCGIPDIIHNTTNNNNGLAPMAYHTMGTRWMKDTVTWKPTKFTDKLTEGQQWVAFQKALDLWAAVIPIKFRYSHSEPDMEVKFARGEHGDGYQNRFNGKGGVLAHAYGPGFGVGGDTHFDEDEDWTVNTGEGTDLTFVAAHEFGHALGLGHSNVPGALMAPYYMYSEDVTLHPDDVQGIQALYGPKYRSTSAPKPATTTSAPTTTKTTSTTTTTTTTTTPDKTPWRPSFCDDNFRLDAISQGPDGFLYAYRDEHVYKIGPNGLEFGYPQYVTEVFPGAPRRHVRAVTYVPETRKTFMFKDSRVWRFTDFSLDEGYPKIWSSDHYYRPSAALTLTYRGVSQIFLFGHDYFWEWNPDTEDIVPGYPLSLETYFPHAPLLPDAAFMNSRGNFIFFKYSSYKKMEHRGVDTDPEPISANLFGSICGGHPTVWRSLANQPLSDQPVFDRGFTELSQPQPEPEFSPLVWSLINNNNRNQREDDAGRGRFRGNGWARGHGRGVGHWNSIGFGNSDNH